MTKKERLFEAIGKVDDELLLQSGKMGRPRPFWYGLAASAACFCLVLGALLLPCGPSVGSSGSPSGDPPASVGDMSGSSEPAVSDESPKNSVPEPDYLAFNTVTEMSAEAVRQDFCLFGYLLTAEELAACAPAVKEDWMSFSGSALYYANSSKLRCIQLMVTGGESEGVSVVLHSEDTPVYSGFVILEPEAKVGFFNDLSYTAYRYNDEYGSLMWAEFSIGGVCYTLSVNCDAGGEDAAEAELAQVLRCYAGTFSAPDLASFTPPEEIVWRNEELSLEEAWTDADFGPYMLTEVPAGFTAESIRRYIDQDNDYLSGLWTSGYDSLSWKVCTITPEMRERCTSVEDKENYDLSLYPIPRAESVPEEKREIVDDPIFLLEELTLDVVYARAYTLSESGDSQGWRMAFSVLVGDTVVEVRAKGISPQWVYEQLMKLG